MLAFKDGLKNNLSFVRWTSCCALHTKALSILITFFVHTGHCRIHQNKGPIFLMKLTVTQRIKYSVSRNMTAINRTVTQHVRNVTKKSKFWITCTFVRIPNKFWVNWNIHFSKIQTQNWMLNQCQGIHQVRQNGKQAVWERSKTFRRSTGD